MKTIGKRQLLLLALAFSIPPALALEVPTRSYGDTFFVSGGIGQEEVQALREAASDYDLGLTFTVGSGEYAADVKVVLTDAAGKVALSTVSDGPILLVDLPPGRYTLAATYGGRTLTRHVAVGKQHREVVMRWPDAEAG